MHMGSLKTQGLFGRKNFKHILLNNNCHESVGEQDTFAEGTNFPKLCKMLGYKNVFEVSYKKDLKKN